MAKREKDRKANDCRQNTIQNTKYRETQTPSQLEGALKRQAVPPPTTRGALKRQAVPPPSVSQELQHPLKYPIAYDTKGGKGSVL